MMHGENGTPETPEWQPEAKAWDDKRCCPTTCASVCESATHAVFMHLPDNVILGTN